MKKFFTNMSLQAAQDFRPYLYHAVGNETLQMDAKVSFPILTAVSGYVKPGEEFRLIAVTGDKETELHNCDILRTELDGLCRRKGFLCPRGVEVVPAPKDQRVSNHLETFQKLIDYVEDDDELFACITYGTKPMSMSVLMAVQYAYRLKKNTSISCIVYGEIDRRAGKGHEDEWKGYVYDETALIQLGEITRVLAERGVEDPRRIITGILAL